MCSITSKTRTVTSSRKLKTLEMSPEAAKNLPRKKVEVEQDKAIDALPSEEVVVSHMVQCLGA